MPKTFSILHKKLEELELQLHHALSQTPTSTLSQEIQQKFVFMANLLSAEAASCPTEPRHLSHIARRLSQLEAAFRDLGEGEDYFLDHVDDSSACSCTESCLNDENENEDEAKSCLEGDDGDGGEFYECVVEEKEDEKERREIVGIGKLIICGAMASGFLIGVASMGVAVFIQFSGYLQLQHNGGFVTPT